MLGLLAECATAGSLACLIDDAQWLDHASMVDAAPDTALGLQVWVMLVARHVEQARAAGRSLRCRSR